MSLKILYHALFSINNVTN